MSWNFFSLVEKLGLHIGNITQVPFSPGYYGLFSEAGAFIYVGKTKNLYRRLADHFGPGEENEWIKRMAKYVIWMPTQTVAKAEEAEGYLYDAWVRKTGSLPFANKHKPPKSKLTDKEIRDAKYRSLFL